MFVRYIVHGLAFVVVHNKNAVFVVVHNKDEESVSYLVTLTLNSSKLSECRGLSDGDYLELI